MDWLQGLFNQQQMAQEQQMMVNDQLLDYGQRMTRTKKRDVIEYLQCMSGASYIDQIDEFETANARHICMGTKEIKILPKGVVSVPTTEGPLPVEYFLCPNCRYLILNKNCYSML